MPIGYDKDMIKKNLKTNKNQASITRNDLGEMSQTIITAVDAVLNKRLKEVRNDVAILQVDARLIKKGLTDMEDRLRKDINNVQILIDGYVKAQEEFKQEFVIIKEEVRQIKTILKEKLGVEIRAI